MADAKIMFVFPGQGSQYPGMGSDIHREFAVAREVYARASEALGYDMVRLSFEDPAGEIGLTRYTQPALLSLRPAARVAFADSRSLPLQVTVLGLVQDHTAPVEVRLLRGDETVTASSLPAGEGETQLGLPLPGGLSPGDYVVSGTVGESTQSAPVTLVASPWQEVVR